MARLGKRDIWRVVIYSVVSLFALSILLPIWNILVISFSTQKAYLTSRFHVIPTSIAFSEYERAFYSMGVISHSLIVSTEVTAFGTCLSMLLTTCGAFALSKKDLPGRAILFRFILFTMFFNGGLVPFYLLVTSLHLQDTILALTLPTALSAFNLVLVKNYFVSLPPSLEEAARIDGYNDVQILTRIILPIAKPVIAAVSLFYAAYYWNDYFMATLFINSPRMRPFQVVLREMIIQNQRLAEVGIHTVGTNTEQFKMAGIIIGIIPMIVVYPFIQKYFSKGVLLGATRD